MKSSSKLLKAIELDQSIQKFNAALEVKRPERGWLEAVRSTMGLTLQETASKSGISRQAIASLELAEREDRITLKRLREVAATLDCELVYALVPKQGTLEEYVSRQLEDAEKAAAAADNAEKRLPESTPPPPSLAVVPEPQAENPHPIEAPAGPSRPADRPGGLLLWW